MHGHHDFMTCQEDYIYIHVYISINYHIVFKCSLYNMEYSWSIYIYICICMYRNTNAYTFLRKLGMATVHTLTTVFFLFARNNYDNNIIKVNKPRRFLSLTGQFHIRLLEKYWSQSFTLTKPLISKSNSHSCLHHALDQTHSCNPYKWLLPSACFVHQANRVYIKIYTTFSKTISSFKPKKL